MKTNLDSLFKSNPNAEVEGVIFEINDNTSFHVRRFGGKNAQKVKAAMAKYYKPYARQVDLGQVSADKEHEILVNAFVDACMIGWEGVELDGKDTDYSVEAARTLFIRLPELFTALHEYASSFESFKEDLGNS
jgi:hypothetical protein